MQGSSAASSAWRARSPADQLSRSAEASSTWFGWLGLHCNCATLQTQPHVLSLQRGCCQWDVAMLPHGPARCCAAAACGRLLTAPSPPLCTRFLRPQEASVIVLCFSMDKPGTLRRVSSYWMPELRRLGVHVPVMLVGCKSDVRPADRSLHEVGTACTLVQYGVVAGCWLRRGSRAAAEGQTRMLMGARQHEPLTCMLPSMSR